MLAGKALAMSPSSPSREHFGTTKTIEVVRVMS